MYQYMLILLLNTENFSKILEVYQFLQFYILYNLTCQPVERLFGLFF